MPRRFSTNDIVRALTRAGFHQDRQRGSHIQMTGSYGGSMRTATVVANKRIVNPRDVSSILRQSGLTRDELERLVDL